MRHKRNTILAWKTRANRICSHETLIEEYRIIESQLKVNGYPKTLIKNTKINSTDRENNQVDAPNVRYISTPYIKGASEQVGRLLKDHNIRLSNKSTNTLRKNLCRLKDKIETEDKTHIVYCISCKNCDKVYIGETGRHLKNRIQEHQRNIINEEPNSQIYQHKNLTGHAFDFENVKILATEENPSTRRFLEAGHSKIKTKSINRKIDIPEIFLPAIKNSSTT